VNLNIHYIQKYNFSQDNLEKQISSINVLLCNINVALLNAWPRGREDM